MKYLHQAIAQSVATPDERDGRVYGWLPGVVTDLDTKLMRVKARIGKQEDGDSTDWLLPCFGGSVEELPEVGDPVAVDFLDGDPHAGRWSSFPQSTTQNRPTEALGLGTTTIGLLNNIVDQLQTLQTLFNAHTHTYVYGTTGTPPSPWSPQLGKGHGWRRLSSEFGQFQQEGAFEARQGPMSYTPVNSDATNVAGYTITRLNATSPSSSAVTSDQAVAIADSYLGTVAYLDQHEAACTGSGSTTSTSFGNVTNMPTYTFSAPVAKVYLVHVDICGIFQSAGSGGIALRLSNNTNSTIGNNLTWSWFPTAINTRSSRFSACTPITMVAGNNVLQMQWKVLTGGDTAAVDTVTSRAFTVTG
jgi:hypothetical protein